MKQTLLSFVLLLIFLFSCKTDRKASDTIDLSKIDTITTSSPIKSAAISASKLNASTTLTPPIQGIDISHFQGVINWQEIKDNEVDYVYIKASQGNTFKDPKFKTNRSFAKKNNIYRGAYHFYVSGIDPIKQATNFIEAVKQLESGDLPPVLDLEAGGIKSRVNKNSYHKNTLQWLQYVEKRLGVTPIIYCSPAFGNEYLANPSFAKYKLWLAEYTKNKPTPPVVWQKAGWVFWQRTDHKKLNGVKEMVDYDLFNGDRSDFLKLVKQ